MFRILLTYGKMVAWCYMEHDEVQNTCCLDELDFIRNVDRQYKSYIFHKKVHEFRFCKKFINNLVICCTLLIYQLKL